jgi:hypothetical protein
MVAAHSSDRRLRLDCATPARTGNQVISGWVRWRWLSSAVHSPKRRSFFSLWVFSSNMTTCADRRCSEHDHAISAAHHGLTGAAERPCKCLPPTASSR